MLVLPPQNSNVSFMVYTDDDSSNSGLCDIFLYIDIHVMNLSGVCVVAYH